VQVAVSGFRGAVKVNVTNIDNVFASRIHCGAVGVNGPVGVTVFAGAPAGGV
jgi:hypothetical protein